MTGLPCGRRVISSFLDLPRSADPDHGRMFTGIIEDQALLHSIEASDGKHTFRLESRLAQEFKVDQSVCHDGVCLTVEAVQGMQYQVTAIPQTLKLTTLGSWQMGQRINLERSMRGDGRWDGHFVQGHVDAAGQILAIQALPGEWRIQIQIPPGFEELIVPQGSIALSGISLTVAQAGNEDFTVAIIPYTFAHTNVQYWQAGLSVNLEFDILGKYLARMLKRIQPPATH